MRIRICDFYHMQGERIAYNWMMLDLPDLLRQAGRRVLPRAVALPDDGWFQAPRGMDGIPAPYSPLTPPELAGASRKVALALLEADWFDTSDGASSRPSPLWSPSMHFYGPSGIGFASSVEEYMEHVLGPVRRGFSERSYVLDLLTCEGAYCGAHGYLHAVHSGCFLGEAASGRAVKLRVALHWHVVEGVALDGYAMFDTPALFKQLGIDLLSREAAPPPCSPPRVTATRVMSAEAGSTVSAATASLLAPTLPTKLPTKLPTLPTSTWSNECLSSSGMALQPPTADAPATFLADCPAWVIATTDAVWAPGRSAADINGSLHEHFYEGWESTSTFGRRAKGMKSLETLVWNTKRAFPDLKIHITDVVCVGNDVDGYKTIMPDVLVGTHLGPSEMYGEPTHKSATWAGLALCYVQKVNGKWQYVAEWVVHDELAAALQLGVAGSVALPPQTTAQPHDCTANLPSWGWQPPVATDGSGLAVAAQLAKAEPEDDGRVGGPWSGLVLVLAVGATLLASVIALVQTVWKRAMVGNDNDERCAPYMAMSARS